LNCNKHLVVTTVTNSTWHRETFTGVSQKYCPQLKGGGFLNLEEAN